MAIFKGAGVAIVTPMKGNFEVNYDKLEELIDFQIKNGTDCIVIAGTTGESSTLSMEEHKELKRRYAEYLSCVEKLKNLDSFYKYKKNKD